MTANIVIIDDVPDNLRILTQLLGKQGYNVRAFSEGRFALEAILSQPTDLILLDIKMPGMDGYEVCQQLKADERTCDIPVIFLSALGEVQDKLKGFEAGGVDYITKPFQYKEVLARVKTHVTLRRLQQDLQQEVARRGRAEDELTILNQRLRETNQCLEETNRQLFETNHQLYQANASKDKFFAIIAHDLRNPFTSLIGMTGAIIEHLPTYSQDKIQQRLVQMQTTAEKTYALLSNLLTWSRLQRDVMEYTPAEVQLGELARHNLLLLDSGASQKNISLLNRVPDETIVYADYYMADTILRNLLSNALKFTPSDGTIELAASVHDDCVEVSVIDTGIGMRPEELEMLFRIEAKSSKPGTDGEEGTGLGLILCKELVEKNGGTIRVHSELNNGTSFTFTLPVASMP